MSNAMSGLDSRPFAFFDPKAHLQALLGDGFSVLSERVVNINNPQLSEAGKIPVIIRQMRGVIYDDCASLPYQIDFYIDEQSKLDVVNEALKLANRIVTSYTGYRVSQTYNNPSLMESSDEFGSGGLARYSSIAYFFVYENASDIESISIDNVAIDWLTCTITWQSEGVQDKNNDDFLLGSDPQSGTTHIVLKTISKRNALFDKLRLLRTGASEANAQFIITIKYIDPGDGTGELTETHYCVCPLSSESHAKAGQLPSLDVTFAEKRK